MRDKKVFLLDKGHYSESLIKNLTEKDLEEWVAEEDYEDNYTIIKIDANDYESVEEAVESEVIENINEYYVFAFGF